MKQRILASVVLLLVEAALSPAASLVVPDQHRTIQGAINAARDGDTVIVSPGTYHENVSFKGKAVTVRSVNPADPNIVTGTVIDADGVGSAVTFANGEGPDAVLTGFTITRGKGTLQASPTYDIYLGAGIYCYQASPTIKGNVVTANNGPTEMEDDKIIALSYGGGICCLQSRAVITRNIIKANSASLGGGIVVLTGYTRITSNLLYENLAIAGGGVVLLEGGQLINNTLIGNSSGVGGNVYGSGQCLIVNNIVGNAPDGGGILLEGPVRYDAIAYNNVLDNVWNGAEGNYLRVADPETGVIELDDQTGLNGNISVDPIFVNPDANDYHLQMGSPCKDAGDPCSVPDETEQDIDGEPRIMDYRVDIGADEYSGNVKPIADAGLDQTMSTIPSLVTLDGSGSYDPLGDPLTYRWNQIGGPAVELSDADAIGPTFVPSEFGIYVFELVVNDGLTDSKSDTVGIVIGNNHAPVAYGGPDRYAGPALVLNGAGSYDPDGYGTLTYQWRQVSGPHAVITDAHTATPTVTFTQTGLIQECRFELIVSDGDMNSLPGTVTVTIVPNFDGTKVVLENPPFDSGKPTIVYFAGGSGGGPLGAGTAWEAKANMISFSTPHNGSNFDRHGNAIIAYLSSQSPNYNQAIQTMGHSNGGKLPAAVGAYLNKTYADRRYNVNRVTFLDAHDTDVLHIANFLNSSVDGEQCWVDNYFATHGEYYPGVLNVRFPVPPADHGTPITWYILSSLDPTQWPGGNIYNGGVTAGAYLSVIGPGKNLQLSADASRYYFKWVPVTGGFDWAGYVGLYNESLYPGRLPEPVKLIGPEDGAVVDANGAVLSCEESENAVGYQLLFGPDPYHMVFLISDTDLPPNEAVTTFPFEKTYWTIRAYDRYGSTIHADPICINTEHVTPPVRVIENLTTGKRYDYIQPAIDEANSGDEIVVSEGVWQYVENINFKGNNLTLRSTDPRDPAVVARTVINGNKRGPVVTFSGGEDESCVLAGFTITGGAKGIYCLNACPTIANCRIVGNGGSGIESSGTYLEKTATITNCSIVGNSGSGVRWSATRFRKIAIITGCTIVENEGAGIASSGQGYRAMITNCTVAGNAGPGFNSLDGKSYPTIINSIVWGNSDSQVDSSAAIGYSDIEGGWSGPNNINRDPCFVSPAHWANANDPNIPAEPDDPNAVWVGGDYHLLPRSPCIDAGDNEAIPKDTTDLDGDGNTTEPIPFDLDGNPRMTGDAVDMGAYETILNVDPVACIVGGDRTVEAASGCNARVTLDGSCSGDYDSTPGTNDDIVYFDWYETDPCEPEDIFLGSGEVIECNLPLGEHIIALEVTDKAGAFDSNEVTISVVDTTAPEISLSVTPEVLWPPNHKMVEITPRWTVTDNCDESPQVSLISVTVNEADDAKGDGHTTDDIQIGDDGSIYLRAERSGAGTGRIYTITYQAVDGSGNTALASAAVTVPHDKRKPR